MSHVDALGFDKMASLCLGCNYAFRLCHPRKPRVDGERERLFMKLIGRLPPGLIGGGAQQSKGSAMPQGHCAELILNLKI